MCELTLSTSLLWEHSLPDAIKKAKEAGYRQIEINGLKHTNGLVNGKYSPQEIKELLTQMNMQVSSFHTYKENWTYLGKDTWTRKEMSEYYKKLSNVAQELGGKIIIVDHINRKMLLEEKEKQLSILKEVVDIFSSKGVIYTIENLRESPEESAEILDKIPELMFTFDILHCYSEGFEPKSYFDLIGNRIVNLHLLGYHPALEFSSDGIPPGFDSFSWKEFRNLLLRHNYNGELTVELETIHLTKILLSYLMVFEDTLVEKEEFGIVPLETWIIEKDFPRKLFDLDIGKIRLSYKPQAPSPKRTFNDVLAIYARKFFEDNLLKYIKK